MKGQKQRYTRHKRIRAKIRGTARVPRLCVFRSNKHIFAQLIDDEKGKTLVSASDLELSRQSKSKKTVKVSHKTTQKRTPKDPAAAGPTGQAQNNTKPLSGKIAIAYEVGRLIAQKALKKKIEKVVFDRGGDKYHGRVKALAEGAREGGLKF